MRFALNGQGLVSFDDLLVLTETDIDQIANAIRKPGGVIPNPAFNPNFPVPVVLPTLPNPGLPIGHLPVKRLKLLRYYVCHLRRTQRSFNLVEASLDQLTDVYKLKEIEEEKRMIE
jgi:hypothetical protein